MAAVAAFALPARAFVAVAAMLVRVVSHSSSRVSPRGEMPSAN
jgi:hypothetical protein